MSSFDLGWVYKRKSYMRPNTTRKTLSQTKTNNLTFKKKVRHKRKYQTTYEVTFLKEQQN